jgi:hypothetical protein
MRTKRRRKSQRVKRQQSKCECLGGQCTETITFVTRCLWSVYRRLNEGRDTVLGTRRPADTELSIDDVHDASVSYFRLTQSV